jgi:hypothetical protein
VLNEPVDVIEESSSSFVRTSPRKLRMSVQSAMLPHPEKRKKGGEDAFFVTEDGKAIGVADGSFHWRNSG